MEYQSGAVRPVDSISNGWNLIKNNYWTFFLMILVTAVILIVASFVLGLINNGITFVIAGIFGAATQNSGTAGKMSAAILPQIIAMVISIFTNAIVITLSGALYVGIYTALTKQSNSGNAEFGDLFSGFQKIKECLIVAVILSAIQFVISIALLIIGLTVGVSAYGLRDVLFKDGQLDPAVFGGLFVGILVLVLVMVVFNLVLAILTSFVYPIIANFNLSGGQALMLSAKSGLANFVGMLLLLILMFLMAMGGVIVCFVGVLFVAPIIVASLFSAYQSVFGRSGGSYNQMPPPPPNFGGQYGNQPGY